jgi:LAO/AO transport system kinase
VHDLVSRVLAGEVRAAARLCRLVDDRVAGHRELLRELYPHTGSAWVVGVTGNPGAGKSTLTDRLIQQVRSAGQRVGVIAVDPTSPFTGGAILGDRIRMQRHFEDPEVFIRSVATRGALGGLSRSVADLAIVLEAWGAHVILVETVGVGQDELEVTRLAHSTVVVVAPGLGDDIQAIKAGLLECADVFAVNKADRDGADATVRDLELMLALGTRAPLVSGISSGHSAGAFRYAQTQIEQGDEQWTPAIVRCVATANHGTGELMSHLQAHRSWLQASKAGRVRRALRGREQLLTSLRDTVSELLLDELRAVLDALVERVQQRQIDPYEACEHLLSELKRR